MHRIRSLISLATFTVPDPGLVTGAAWAQSAQSASLVGKVTDESGAGMPGRHRDGQQPAVAGGSENCGDRH